MGEIKSTLDLVMEKTRNLSMSPEEKKEALRQEWLKKSRGLIQKWLDEQISLEKLKEDLFNPEPPLNWERDIKKELIQGLDPEGDNEKRLELLSTLLSLSPKPLVKILETFNLKLFQEKTERMERIKKQWRSEGISGSAVIPNLERDPAWRDFVRLEKETVKEKLLTA